MSIRVLFSEKQSINMAENFIQEQSEQKHVKKIGLFDVFYKSTTKSSWNLFNNGFDPNIQKENTLTIKWIQVKYSSLPFSAVPLKSLLV